MVTINLGESESLSEYLILTGWVQCRPEEVSLGASLGPIQLQYPFMTARMQSVVGEQMAVVAGRNGILTVIPRSLRDSDKQNIIDANLKARLRKGDMEFQDNPEYATPESTLEDVVRKVERVGHSIIPIMDRFSRLLGVYIHDPENPNLVPNTPVEKVMYKLRRTEEGGADSVFCLPATLQDKDEIRRALESQKRKFIPMIDEQGILRKLVFLQKFDTNYIGIAVTTRDAFEEEIERWGSQVDTLCIDSSNACFEDAIRILKYVKSRFPEKPFGVGNIIQARDFRKFAEAGADYIIGGMGVGSICQTGAERGNGRGQFTVARELASARDAFVQEKGVYIPLVIDGGIAGVKEMTVALAFADFIMMGNYFNRFYEAAAQKFEADKKTTTTEESLMRYVESWGEGHPRARLVAAYGIDFRNAMKKPEDNAAIERYGHLTLAGSTVEGVVGLVGYTGRLKPCVERDARYIRTTIANAGARDLEEFRDMAVLEKASARTLYDMLPHDVQVTEQ